MDAISPEQAQRTLRRMATYIRRHAAGNANLEAWADFIEALPSDGEEALAFARSQREAGFPDEFRPRCDDGLYMRTYGLADRPPPSPGTLRELVALEGADEPLDLGAYFPMEPTPVRDGLPLWAVDVRVISAKDLWSTWETVYELADPRLEGVRGYGVGELPDDNSLYHTELRIWAASERDACAIAEPLVDTLMGGAQTGRRKLQASPAVSDEWHELPRSPKDYETSLVATRWHRHQASPAGVKIAWFTGPCPLERVDVDETPQRVTITLSERYPPRFAPGGTPYASAAIGRTHCVEVQLQAPLGARDVIDGATGRAPDHVDDFDYVERNTVARFVPLDLDTLDCRAAPSSTAK